MALRGFPTLSLFKMGSAACVALALLAVAASPAEARWRHHYGRYHSIARASTSADPTFAAIVVDANAGRTLYAVNPDAPRHPASLTKVMTLYLLFEQLDKGAMTLETQIPISEHAAAQEPSKLGIAAGDSISVEDAIKAIVTRSANDVAVAISEAIGGDESRFAEMMTRKAHALGMSRTLYRNASGLPNDEQITTARDLTILARATEERFPRYFKYYSTHEFDYDGEIIGNHNHLLGRVDGVDGIKTGYTRASGFNLLTSVHRDGRSLVAVVLGGRTASARDAVMESLIREHLAEASDRGHTAPMIAEAATPPAPPVKLASLAVPPGAIPAPPARPADEQTGEGDDEGAAEEADAAPPAIAAPPSVRPPTPLAASPAVAAKPAPLVAQPSPSAKPPVAAPPAVAAKPAPFVAQSAPSAAPPAPSRPVVTAFAAMTPAQLGWIKGPDPAFKGPSADAALAAALRAKATTAAEPTPAAADKGGWIIQIGVSDDPAKATDLVARAKTHAPLAQARGFTEKVAKDGDIFYRARFTGLDSAGAESACRSLKKSGFACFAARD